MSYTPIAIGAPDWGPPLNAALTDQDSRITTNAGNISSNSSSIATLQGQMTTANTNIATNATRVNRLTFDVKTYGAVGDNSTNDQAAVQSAINAASAAGGGEVFFPPGVYAITPVSGVGLTVPSNVRLVGAGRRASQIRRNGNSVLIDISGPSSDPTGATHARYSGVQDITLNGNSNTGAILRCYYTDNCDFVRVLFTSSQDVCVDGVEFWDSRFQNCQFENSGGAADAVLPNVWLRNASAASGFGSSSDNVNQIVFDACRWEAFQNGALRIEQGSITTNNPNGIYITNCKMESSLMRGGSHLFVQDACRGVWVDGLYCFAGNFFSGYSTAQNIINWSPQASALHNVLIANGGVATVNSGVLLFSGAGSVADLKNVVGQYNTVPTGAHIFNSASSTADFSIQNCWATGGTQFGGTAINANAGVAPVRMLGAIPTDAQFAHTPQNGTLAVNNSGTTDLYVRSGGVWKQVVRSGVANLTAGTATVATSAVTANTRIQLTSNVDGGTPGFLRVSARTAGTSFTITSSSGTDTSTVAWQMTEP